jgi:hypothetical protein
MENAVMSSSGSPVGLGEKSAEPGPGGQIYVAFVPWILFSVITQHGSLRAAAVVALTAAVAISVPSLLRGRPKVLELSAVAAFMAFVAVAFSVDPGGADWVARYARALAAGGLAVTAFSSLLFVPFTEQYARASVPRQFWSSPAFRQVNRRLTTMWGWVFVAMVPAHLLAGAIDTHRANTIFNWVIPVVLVTWAAQRTAALSDNTGAACNLTATVTSR